MGEGLEPRLGPGNEASKVAGLLRTQARLDWPSPCVKYSLIQRHAQVTRKVKYCNLIGLPKSKTADLAQPRNRSTVTRPFSSLGGGVWGRDYFTEARLLPLIT